MVRLRSHWKLWAAVISAEALWTPEAILGCLVPWDCVMLSRLRTPVSGMRWQSSRVYSYRTERGRGTWRTLLTLKGGQQMYCLGGCGCSVHPSWLHNQCWQAQCIFCSIFQFSLPFCYFLKQSCNSYYMRASIHYQSKVLNSKINYVFTEVSSAPQACIYWIQNTANAVIFFMKYFCL